MKNSSNPSDQRPEEWLTAGLFDSIDARSMIARLESRRIGYHTAVQGALIRVSVDRESLNEAMSLSPDRHSRSTRQHGRSGAQLGNHAYRLRMRLLCSLPLGAFLGTLACYHFEAGSQWVPMMAAVGLATIVEILVTGWMQRRQTAVRSIA
ncbi:MAG: hypothetical protein AAF664_13735 [Planctomycetota bacterium]